MSVKDLTGLITDFKLEIELIEEKSGASFGFYNCSYIPENFLTKEIKNVNVQYIGGKRLLVIKF